MRSRAQDLNLLEMNAQSFPLTLSVLQSGVMNDVAPGFVGGVWEKKNPTQFHLAAMGQRRVIPTPLPMELDTVFDLASVSKVFATATLCAVLVDRGWLSWDTYLSSIFPEYRFPEIQIQHLLAHTAGFPAWKPLWETLWQIFSPDPIYSVSIKRRQETMRRLVFSIPPEVAPGERVLYSDITFLLLGFALEEITQMPLDQAVKHFVWDPMGISRAYYCRVTQSPAHGMTANVAATEDCPHRGGVLQGQVHDDNCWAMGGYGGHAGVFTDARDVFHFVRSLMGGFLSPAVLRAMWTKAPLPVDCSRTLGWDTPSGDTSSTGHKFSPHTVGHLGFTGTSLWIDLDAELAVVLLSNRVHPSRDSIKIREFRPRFHDAIRKDLKR